MKLLIVITCIGIIWWVEYDRNAYIDSLPKEKRDELIKKQSQMRCSHCLSTDFEVVGMKHNRLLWQCKHCKRIRK
jgi:ribosomal protein L37AE/L43A